MEKYFMPGYNERTGEDFCDIYDEDLRLIRTVNGKSVVEGLKEITKLHSEIAELEIVMPLNEEFGLVIGLNELTEAQNDIVNRNIGI